MTLPKVIDDPLNQLDLVYPPTSDLNIKAAFLLLGCALVFLDAQFTKHPSFHSGSKLQEQKRKLLKQDTGNYVAEGEALEAVENLNDIADYEDGYGDLARQAYLTVKVAIKRNEPVKLLKEKKYLYEFEWYTVFGKCPLCNHYNPSTANYCGNCGQALEKLDWSEIR